ncbi:hypothetical protein ACMT1E_05150 [Sphingomonas flavalba]|uniref:hypothetical protein n=1 Tax=Sphingomonas flavalba TaxID=2559804 RepID=UPI0039E0F11A
MPVGKVSVHVSRAYRGCGIAAMVLALVACGRDTPTPPIRVTPTPTPSPTPPATILPAGRLVQATTRGPLSYVTLSGWRVGIADGVVTVRPPAGTPGHAAFQYTSSGTREALGGQEVRNWAQNRRSLLLPGGGKVTMHGQDGALLRVSLYDGDESHEIDVLTQTIMHSKVDAPVAASRDAAEHDGEAAYLIGAPGAGLYLANVYVEDADASGNPQEKRIATLALGRQLADAVHAYGFALPPAPAEVDAVCDAVPQPRGNLVQNTDSTMRYVSRSGLWTVQIDKHTITVTRAMGPRSATWQVWGDPHENLNGKHIKDWDGSRRTLLLDDGTKITMHADGPHHVVHTTSIYDGAQSHEIGNFGNLIRHSCVNAATAAARERQEADGETAHLVNLRGPAAASGSLLVKNVYTETIEAGGAVLRDFRAVLMGETGDLDENPNQVNDLYDDPRLGHT